MDEKIYQIIYHWVKMCAAEVRQKMNCHIYLIIYWILLVMKKYWDCIKECVEGICIYPGCVKSYIEAYREMWEDEVERLWRRLLRKLSILKVLILASILRILKMNLFH